MLYLDWNTGRFEIGIPNDCKMTDYLHGYYDALEDVRKLINSKPNNMERLSLVMNYVEQIIGEDEQEQRLSKTTQHQALERTKSVEAPAQSAV